MKSRLLLAALFGLLMVIILLSGCPTIDKPPKLTIPDKTVDEGQVLQFDLKQYAEDKDKNTLVFTVVSGVGEIVGSDYRYAPAFDNSGEKEVKVRVTNAKGKSAEDTFKITVNNVNRSPVLDIPDQTIDEGETLTLNLNDYADDPDGDDLTFTLVSGVGEITVATYTYTPDYDVLKKVREYNPAAESVDFEVSISANDGKGGEATATFTITVTDVNRPPALDIPDQTIDEGETLTLNLLDYTTDPDTLDTFTYTLLSGVGNIAGSTYTYTATYTDAGTKTVTVRVTDNKGGTGDSTFKITVNDVNRPPTVTKVSGPPETIDASTSTFTWRGSDPDGEIEKYEYRKDEGDWIDHGLNTSYTWSGYSEGAHKFEVRAQDNYGEYSEPVEWNFTYSTGTVVVGEMVLVEKGTFMMGDTWGGGYSDEYPVHQVTLTYDFYMGKYEVTFDEYDAFCEATGRIKPKDEDWGRGNRPVVWVSWWDAIAYCNWLSETEGIPVAYRLREEASEGQMLDANGNVTTDITKVIGYRLPTEAEWEYAARGGKYYSPYKYSGSDNVDEVAWYTSNSGIKTHEVGLKLPNALGIYDMSGNVWELCSDWWYWYTETPKTNPYNSTAGSGRVIRGGSWNRDATSARVAYRDRYSPTFADYGLGFRIARTVP